MKVTVFTGNQPRHVALVSRMAALDAQIFAVLESSSVIPRHVTNPGKEADVLGTYFATVARAEARLFGDPTFLGGENISALSIGRGDLTDLKRTPLEACLDSDLYIVFGASFIKGWLIDFLVEKSAINIHIGLSPYYRGAACNFWALYDDRPEYVGATIHLLSRGVDSGKILYHAVPKIADDNPFEFTMRSVEAAHFSLVEKIKSRELWQLEPVAQDKSLELRYSRIADFTESIAAKYLSRGQSGEDLKRLLARAPAPILQAAWRG